MATYQPARITKLMREKNFPCYVISDGRNEFDSQLNEKMSVAEATERLMEALSEVSGNDVSVEIAPAVDAKGKLAGRGKMHFERVDLSNHSTAKSVAGISGNENALVQKLVQNTIDLEKQLIELKAQQKIDELKQRLEALERGEGGGINGVLNGLMQNEAVQGVLANWLVNAAGMGQQQTTMLNGLSPSIEQSVERLKAIDDNFEIHLAQLADLAEKNREKYFFALTML